MVCDFIGVRIATVHRELPSLLCLLWGFEIAESWQELYNYACLHAR